MLPFPSWKIRKDRNIYGGPSSNFSYFPLVIRIPNPTIAQRNTSFRLGAFYPYVMFLYFFYLVQFTEYISHTMHVYPTLLQKENFPKKFQGN